MTFDIEDTKARHDLLIAALRADLERHARETVSTWRAENPEATCSDRVAFLLHGLAAAFGGKR